MDTSKFDTRDVAFFIAFAIIVMIFLTDGLRVRYFQNRRFAALAKACDASVTAMAEQRQQLTDSS